MKKNIVSAVFMFIAAVACLVFGIIMIPGVTTIGNEILLILIGVILLIYVYGFLLPKVLKKVRGVNLVLTIIEMTLLTLIAVTCVLVKFLEKEGNNPIFGGEATMILGFAIWIRGVVESFRAYYYKGSTSTTKYPVYKVFINVALITLGTWVFFTDVLKNENLILTVAILLLVACVILVILGVLKITKKANKTSKKSKKDKEEELVKETK